VLIDGNPTRSCSTRVSSAEGKQVRTIEGLAPGDKLHPLQEAFLKVDAMQCGYCIPGMLMSALALLTREPDASREDIIRGMNGNVCRCGVYSRIVEAIELAAKTMKGGGQ
jgi:carbon-monoxide dehydrogenase small subunit